MAKEVTLINKYTGDIKTINTGWSWSILLFSPFLSIPLFVRELYISATIITTLWVINMFMVMMMISFNAKTGTLVTFIITLSITLATQIFLAIKGNQMSINEHMQNGWEISEQ